jgi:hypothetical protein
MPRRERPGRYPQPSRQHGVHRSHVADLGVYAHYGDVEYHAKCRKEDYRPSPIFIHKQDEETLLWTIYELHAQIRSARDQFCGTDDDAPEKAVAEATADQLTPE